MVRGTVHATKRKARGNDAAGCKNIGSRVSVPSGMSAFCEAQVMDLSCMAQLECGQHGPGSM